MFTKLFGEANGIFNKITIMGVIISLIYIITGLTLFIFPSISDLVVSILIGIYFILSGVVSIFAFLRKSGIEIFNFDIAYGLIFITIGIVSFFLSNMLSIVIGVYLIFEGIKKITYSLCLKKFNESSWLIILVTGILFLLIAILAFFTKGEVVKIAGILLFGCGFINLINTILLRRRSKYFIGE